MSIPGFKNLIKASTFLDDSFQQLLKKSDQNRRSSKMSLEYIQALHKLFQTFQISFETLLLESSQEITEKGMSCHQEFFSVFEQIFAIQNAFAKRLKTNIKETIEMSNNLFKNYSNLILSFQSVIRTYLKNEQILADQSKRYFKSHKLMQQNIELYKASFTDVKLIYNTDEKIKRYLACEANYKLLIEEIKMIEEKLMIVNQLKKEVIQNYKNIEYEFVSAIKIVGNRIITLSELFAFQYKEMLSNLSAYLKIKSSEIIQCKGSSLSLEMLQNKEFFNIELNLDNCRRYPNFIVYFANLKPQYYSQIGKMYTNYLKQMTEKIEGKKKATKSLFQFILSYFKQYQRLFQVYLRDINSNYEKNKKKISQLYGNQHMKFVKAFSTVFQKVIEKGDALSKNTSLKIKTIQYFALQQARILDMFLKDAKIYSERFIKKKQVKKNTSPNKNLFQAEEELGYDNQAVRLQIGEKVEAIRPLIDSLLLKVSQGDAQINIHYNAIINDFTVFANQLYTFCNHFHQNQFDQSLFLDKYQTFQSQIDEIMKKKISFFSDLSFGTLLLENEETITFDPELNKVEQFKKIKKPTQYENQKIGESIKKRQGFEQKVAEIQQKPINPQKIDLQEINERTPDKAERIQNSNKYQQLLFSKVSIQQGQKYIQSYACGLSDKIILTGRLHITNQRLCFHSKFNTNNVFFGDTFLQIPKKDILKVEKRQNAIIFNNSISITTINGEVFFTSFFSRNQAFDLICRTFQINNNEDLMFEAPSIQFINEVQIEEIKQDDLGQEKIPIRKIEIDKLVEAFDYIEIYSTEFSFVGLNAFKFYKLFETNNQITYNRKTCKGFNMYIKQLLNHRDVVLGQWSPDLNSYLNAVNIKDNTPLQFERTIKSVIPVANSGIPLMPKQSQLQEDMKLYFYSKDKFEIDTKVSNSGIPYCEYFNIHYKKVVETVGENKCRLTLFYYIQFVQKTMMKSVIQSKSTEESKIAISRHDNQIKKYLKHLQKMQIKPSKEASNQNLHEKVRQLQKELQQSREREERLANQSQTNKNARTKERNLLFASIALNLLLLIIVISFF